MVQKTTYQVGLELSTADPLAALKKLQAELDATSKKASTVGKASKDGFGPLTNSVKGLAGAFSSLGSVIAGISFGAIAASTVRTITDFETLNTVLKTITGSTEAATAAFAQLQTLAQSTPFSVQQLGESFIKLKAAGIEPTNKLLTLFSDVASVTTDKVGALQAITDLYARTTAGGLGLEELNRLADRGIPVFDILSKKLGVNRLQLSELGKTAQGAKLILDSLEQGLGAAFGGSSAAQLNTLGGQFDTLTKSLEKLALAVGDAGATDGLKTLLSTLNQVVSQSEGAAQTVGSVLGDALKSLATGILYVSSGLQILADNWELVLTVITLIVPVFRLIGGLFTAGRIAILGIAEGAAVVGPILKALGTALKDFFSLSNIGKTFFDAIATGFSKFISLVASAKGAVVGLLVAAGILGKQSIDKFKSGEGNDFGITTPKEVAKTPAQIADEAAQKLALDLATGRSIAIAKIVANLRQETSIIGLNKQEAEAQNKILEVQAGIRDKLLAAGKTQEQADAGSKLSTQEAGRIRSAVAAKYSAELANQIKLLREAGTFEISLLGQSSNEIEKQTKLREILVSLGKQNTATEKERADILKEVTRLQDAQINSKLTDTVVALRNETDLLKLGNTEREKRNELDKAAQDAGFRNRADLLLNATPQQRSKFDAVSSAIDVRNQEAINNAGRKSIDTLKEQAALLSIIDEKERDRYENQQNIYKQIDPEGKGKNITQAQKDQIAGLQKYIEEQNALIAVNKQIQDSFQSLGDAVTQSLLGAAGSTEKLKLALIKLAALEAFKYFAGGISSGNAGSFFSGLISGLGGSRAAGGSVSAGVPYRMNENGPETVMFGQNGFVIPNQQAHSSISSSTGNITVQINPMFSNHGTINSTEDLEGYMAKWGEGIASQTKTFVTDQFKQSGLAYR